MDRNIRKYRIIAPLAGLAAALFGSYGRGVGAQSPVPPEFASERERVAWITEELLGSLETTGWRYSNVPRADGKFLHRFVAESGLRNGLEMGSANGYSAIWIGLGLEKSKGRLATVEIDPEVAGLCRKNVAMAGLDKTVDCITGDALTVPAAIDGTFDFLFIDLGPMDVLPFFRAAETKLTGNAVIVLHNLGYERSYGPMLRHAEENSWSIERDGPRNGLGFFFIRKSAAF